jgi:flagellar hook-basal body complex protein FliE
VDPINTSNPIGLTPLQENLDTLTKGDTSPEQSPGDVIQSFGKLLGDQINKVNDLSTQCDKAVQSYATGGPISLHQVMIAEERASVSMELASQIRNKMLSAYQEISRISI